MLPTQYQNYIHISRYARWDDDKKRRETWDETVDRYVNFFRGKFPHLPEELFQRVRNAIFNLEVMPSMRALMTAGPALEKENLCGYNCFAGHVRYLTEEGYKTFEETVGTSQIVLNGKGQWVPAEIREFGTQRLQAITFRPGSRSKTNLRYRIVATPDHRWITMNRGEITDLRVGDVVSFIGAAKPELSRKNLEAFVRGFGFGGGTIDHQRGRARVRLCGKKNKWLEYFKILEEDGYCAICYPPSSDGDAVVIFRKGKFDDWKQLPKEENVDYLAWWLEGYLAADGHGDPRQPGISSQDREVIEFVKKIAPMAGYMVTGHNVSRVMETNYGTRSEVLHRLTLRHEGEFKVMAIEELDVEETVYCAVVPDGHDFVLEHGIHTGNCSYIAIDRITAFDEILYILMCGTGVGFSVERQFIANLPIVADTFHHRPDIVIKVADSKIGWAKALRELIHLLYAGQIPEYDTSKVRKAGARLKTMGGRASGPEPLIELFKFTINLFRNAAGRKLTSIECHDLVCKIAEIVVVGGVRRSALISLSNLSDDRMRHAKMGSWWETNGQRALANNSAVYTEKPEIGTFMREWLSLYDSKSGERGLFNREAARRKFEQLGRAWVDGIGCNPCAEIFLRSAGLCNLTEVVIRPFDDLPDLMDKVEIATILGTWQSSLTNFRYVSSVWKKNAEEERLLGVSLTGIMDHPVFRSVPNRDNVECLQHWLTVLREHAWKVNAEMAAQIGINPSKAITCVKPSGTVSQLVDSSSGIHTRYAPYYIRTVRADKKDPLAMLMKTYGFPVEDDITKPDHSYVFSFPMKSPEGSRFRDDLSAIDQLEVWKIYYENWCDHNPSCTIYVKEHEWLDVGAWVYKNFDKIGGLSFLPHSDHIYKQAPYTEITEAEYNEWLAQMPEDVDWSLLQHFEADDQTTGTREYACTAGGCELL